MRDKTLQWRWLNAFREVNRHGRNFSTAEMGILFSMATRASADGTGIHRGIRGIRADTGAKDTTITGALAKARGMEVLERVRRGKRGANVADTYALVPPERWTLDHDQGEEPPY